MGSLVWGRSGHHRLYAVIALCLAMLLISLLVWDPSRYREALLGQAYRSSWYEKTAVILKTAGEMFSPAKAAWLTLPENATDWRALKVSTAHSSDLLVERWERLSDRLLCYSALYHHIISRIVVVIVHNYTKGEQTELNKQLSCSVGQLPDGEMESVSATVYNTAGPFDEHHGALLVCDINQSGRLPRFVRIKARFNGQEFKSHVLPVTYNPKRENMPSNIGACIKPLHHHYKHPKRLKEFIEVLNMFGVTGFHIYYRSLTEDVQQLIEDYQKKNHIQLDMIKFVLPLQSVTYFKDESANIRPGNLNISQYGQMPSIYDCWLRNIYRYKYLLFLDVDELPFVYKFKSYHEMINSSPESNVFVFLNSFFPVSGPSESPLFSNETIRNTESLTLLRTQRYEKIFNFPARSKSLVLTTALRHPDVHKPQAMKPNWFKSEQSSWRILKPDEGLMHHYRDANDLFKNPMLIQHRAALQYKDQILVRLLSNPAD